MTLPLTPPPVTPLPGQSPPPTDSHAELRAVAMELEAAFLSEMLKHAGFGEARGEESFGGGIGEAQFSSLLLNEHASALSARGGLGLAESIFTSLVRRAEAAR